MKGMTRRNFVKMAGIAMATAAAGSLWQHKTSLAETADAPAAPKAAEGGDHYVAPSQRQGGEAVVYFTRDLSAAGLLKALTREESLRRLGYNGLGGALLSSSLEMTATRNLFFRYLARSFVKSSKSRR